MCIRDSPITFREACKEFALKYVDNQREQFLRLGVIGDYYNPYLTLNPEFEAKQIEVFGEMAKKGYIYKGLKPVYWCPDCQTALAEAEIEYDNDPCTSIFVKFRDVYKRQYQYCPHGRPTYIILSKKNIEKQFGRIQ